MARLPLACCYKAIIMKKIDEEDVVSVDRDVCCSEFNPTIWNNKKHEWQNKLFLRDSVPELFHIPLPGAFGKTVTRMMKKIEDADAVVDTKEYLLLAHDLSPFKSELLITIAKDIPGVDVVKLTGTFLSRVFDGPYSQIPKYIHEMDHYLVSLKMKAKGYYFHYAYCPNCAKKYGHNYIVAFAEV
jgi:hypothetical protein